MKKFLLFVFITISCNPHDSSVNWEPFSQNQPFQEQLLLLHNKEREFKGRPRLELNQSLNDYAQQHAEWMTQNNNLKHSNIDNLLNQFHTVGENIAWNQPTPEQVTNDWMHSSGHRANILNRSFTHVGFGVAYNSKNEPYWCTVFGGGG